MMTLWTGLKQLHSISDDKIGPNEEEILNKIKFTQTKKTYLVFMQVQLITSLQNQQL